MRKEAIGLIYVGMVALSAMVLAVPISGLIGVVDDAVAQTEERVLRIGFMQEIDSMNPYIGLNDASYVFYGLIYDALCVIDEDMNPEPDLALEAWPVPEGYDDDPNLVGMPYGSVWQYNLTQNAYWTDGEPFTADDVVFNIELNYQNYDAMWAYQPYSYFMSGAWKVDDYKVRVSFWNKGTREPMPAAYAYLISIPMLPKHLLEGKSPYDIGFNWTGVWPESISPGMPIVGTGPFMGTPSIYDEWVAGDHITLVTNPNYHWKADKGKEIKFDKLVMRFFEDSTSMTLALRNGDIDVAALPPQAYRSVKQNPGPDIVTYDGPKVTQYWTEVGINMNAAGPNPSRLDPAIRHAMHMATNKDYIVENHYLGLADPGTTLIPPVNEYWHYEPTEAEKFQYNLTAAAALLEASGYRDENGDGIRECTIDSLAVQEGWAVEGTPLQYQMLIRREYPEEKDIAAYLEGEWAQIGIDINYKILDESQLSTEVYSYAYDTMIWYWSADIDPNYQLFCLSSFSIGGWSDCKYISEAYDTNYTLSVATLDREQRKVYVDNCQKVFYQDSVYIILAYVYQTYAWRTDRFDGWGDWGAHPGRTVDNFWMGNPLYFDLTYKGDDGTPNEEPENQWMYLAIGGAVAAAVVVAVVVIMLKGKKKGGVPEEGEKKETGPLGE